MGTAIHTFSAYCSLNNGGYFYQIYVCQTRNQGSAVGAEAPPSQIKGPFF